MATFSRIGGAEPSTLTFKAATVTQTRNSSAMHQELISIADPESSLAIVAVRNAAPASTAWAMAVRVVSGPSSVADFAVRAVLSSTAADNPVLVSGNSTVVVSAFAAGLLSTATPSAASSGLNVWAVGGILSSVGGMVHTLPNSTLWASSAGFHFDSSGAMLVSGASASTVVTIAQLLDSSGGSVTAADSANQSIRVSVVSGGSTIVSIAALPAGMLSSAAPAATDTGLFVRMIGYSTIVSVAAMPANSSVVAVASFAAGLISSGTPAAGSSGLIVQQVGYVAPSTTVTIAAGNSSVTVAAFAAGLISTAAPATTSSGLNVWPIGYSTIVTVAAFPANSSKVEITTLPAGLLSTVAPASNSSGLIVRQVITGPATYASASAFATSTLVAINSTVTGQKCKVFAYSFTSTDLTASDLAFYKGSSLVWPVVLQAASSLITGANLAVSPPAYLFATAAGSSMTLRISGSSRAGWRVGVAYFMEP